MDLFVLFLNRLLYDDDRTLILSVPLNEKAIISAINLASLFSSFYPSYEIHLFSPKNRLIRNNYEKKFNIFIEIDKSLRFKTEELEKYYTDILLFLKLYKRKPRGRIKIPKVAVKGEIRHKNDIKKKHFVLEKIISNIEKEFSFLRYMERNKRGIICFKYRNPISFKSYIPFIDESYDWYVITENGTLRNMYVLSRRDLNKLPYRISKFFRNLLHTFSLRTYTLFLIDVVTGKESLESLSKKFGEDIEMLGKRIKKVEKNLLGVLEGILNEANKECSISSFIRNNYELFRIPIGYETFYLKDVLKSLFYFLNPNSKEPERSEMLVAFYNKYAKKEGKRLVKRKEEFYKQKPKIIIR